MNKVGLYERRGAAAGFGGNPSLRFPEKGLFSDVFVSENFCLFGSHRSTSFLDRFKLVFVCNEDHRVGCNPGLLEEFQIGFAQQGAGLHLLAWFHMGGKAFPI